MTNIGSGKTGGKVDDSTSRRRDIAAAWRITGSGTAGLESGQGSGQGTALVEDAPDVTPAHRYGKRDARERTQVCHAWQPRSPAGARNRV
jgi:hypothetical protein